MSVRSGPGDPAGPDAGALALRWLESVRTGLLLVDSDLHVHWANSVAHRWLMSNEPLSQIGAKLHLGRSQQQLRNLLRRADCDLHGICVPVRGPGAHLVVGARRITEPDETAYYGLIARRTDQMDTRLLGVDEAFRLTTAEARVLKQLIRGQTAQAIGKHLDISVETVRTHIRSLYTKLEVGSREALFQRLRPFMLAH